MKRFILLLITLTCAVFFSSAGEAGECVIGKRSIPDGIEGLKRALSEAKSGGCTSDAIDLRNRYGEFYPGTTQYQVIRFDKSADLTVNETLPEIYGNNAMPIVIVASDDVTIKFKGDNARTAFIVRGDRIIFDHITAEGFQGDAVLIKGNKNLFIGSRIVSNKENGIFITGKDNRIVDSEVAENGINGILIGNASANESCGGALSEAGRRTVISGGDIHDNGKRVTETSCADESSVDSIGGCVSLKMEAENCHGLLNEEPSCEEPAAPLNDPCGRFWTSRNRCENLFVMLGLDPENDVSLDEAVTAMYTAFAGANGGHGISIDAQDARVISYNPGSDARPEGALFKGQIFGNQNHDIYVNAMAPAAICQDNSSTFDLSMLQTALVSETAVGRLTVSRYPLPVVSQVAATATAGETTVTGTVRLSDEPWYLWNTSTLSFSSLKAEVFIKNQASGEMKFAGSAQLDEDGRFVVRLAAPLTIDGVQIPDPVFVATVVDTEHGNTSPFLGAHAASPDADDDGDGLPNGQEDSNGNGVVDAGETDPINPDTDADGLMDGAEVLHNGKVEELINQGFVFAAIDRLNPLNPDSDNDCLPDGLELGVTKEEVEALILRMPAKPLYEVSSPCQKILTDSTVTSIDNAIWFDETSPKLWNNVSMLYDLDPATISDPTSSDTDRDGTQDGAEDTNFNGRADVNDQVEGETTPTETSPAESDSDGDGIVDGEEGDRDGDGKLGPNETDPHLYDTDGDGLSDGEEKRIGTYPNACDSDEDGLSDGVEKGAIKPAASGSSCHGLEAAGTNYRNPHLLDPLNPDSDNDGRMDGVEDENGNGWVDTFESDPSISDTDRDGLLDGTEAFGDFDGDLIPDFDVRMITAGPKCSPPEDINDVDCDGMPNWVDVDSDDDGCSDVDEGGRRDLNSNGVPDVYDNEAKGCTDGGGGGGMPFIGGGGQAGTSEEEGSATGAAPAWLLDQSGGGACALVQDHNGSPGNAFGPILMFISFLSISIFRRKVSSRI